MLSKVSATRHGAPYGALAEFARTCADRYEAARADGPRRSALVQCRCEKRERGGARLANFGMPPGRKCGYLRRGDTPTAFSPASARRLPQSGDVCGRGRRRARSESASDMARRGSGAVRGCGGEPGAGLGRYRAGRGLRFGRWGPRRRHRLLGPAVRTQRRAGLSAATTTATATTTASTTRCAAPTAAAPTAAASAGVHPAPASERRRLRRRRPSDQRGRLHLGGPHLV